jgi:RNA polymerase sigma-70 factor, ECF subfamily
VWLKAFRAIGSYRGEAGFYTWLRRITINTFLNQQRETKIMFSSGKQAIRMGELVSLEDLGLADKEPRQEPEERLHQQMMVEKVMEGLGELTPQQRLIFLLKHREGMTYEEIAQSCSVSTGTVKKALFRAVSRLRELLGVRSSPPEDATYAARERHKMG